MGDDILSVMESMAPTLSKGQRRIATYITESYDKAAFMTASKLGKAVGVSESTVVRFAMELGYDGYPTMQKVLQELVMSRLTTVQRMGVTNDRIGDQDVVSSVLQSDMEKLRRTAEQLNREDFQDCVDAFLKARNIYVVGVRSAAALANFAGYYLNYMFDNVHVITTSGTGEMFEKLAGAGPGDAVIAFSFPRYSTSTIKGVQYCRQAGATVVGLTNSSLSPLAQICDHTLIAKSDMVSLVDSLVAPLSVLNALLVALASGKKDVVQKNLDNLERVWDTYNVYEKRNEV